MYDEDERETWASPPSYVEGWPRLDLRAAVPAALAGRTISTFAHSFPGMIDTPIGSAVIASEGDDSFSLDYSFDSFHYLSAARAKQVFEQEISASRVDGNRVYTRCPSCRRRVLILVFKRGWGCKRCHKLIHRSQSVDSVALEFEEMDLLRASVGKGRQRYQRQARFDANRARLQELQAKLAGVAPRRPRAAMCHLVTTAFERPIDRRPWDGSDPREYDD